MRDEQTGREMIFDSYASAAKYLGSDKSSVRKACHNIGRKRVKKKIFYLLSHILVSTR